MSEGRSEVEAPASFFEHDVLSIFVFRPIADRIADDNTR